MGGGGGGHFFCRWVFETVLGCVFVKGNEVGFGTGLDCCSRRFLKRSGSSPSLLSSSDEESSTMIGLWEAGFVGGAGAVTRLATGMYPLIPGSGTTKGLECVLSAAAGFDLVVGGGRGLSFVWNSFV